ncbi:MAG: Gfo/Idh/MocA family oxidoreductase [Verrucomicrobia bacterium]|nr:Gfo/Idh/MocA family oxidoreductase [Verrucomicrobiota bacterium]
MTKRINISRRSFLRTLAGTLAITGSPFFIGTSFSQSKSPASSRIRIGVIGYGKRARPLMNSALKQPDTQIVAISEVVQERLDHGLQTANNFYSDASGKKWDDVRGYIDFREMLGKESLDAVIIATPDHWHSVQCLMAADKKLDIYCEKPLTLNIREGRIISDAVKKHQLVFQTGSQQRSEFGHRFKKAAELIRNGYFGEIKKVYVNVGAPPRPLRSTR